MIINQMGKVTDSVIVYDCMNIASSFHICTNFCIQFVLLLLKNSR